MTTRISTTALFMLFAIGMSCSTKQDCSNNGNCVNGQCNCFPGYTGDTCSESSCLHGEVKNGKCKCSIGATLTNGACVKDCGKHGNYSVSTDSCICEEGWTTAGITDTIAYFEGTCSQFQCESDKQCQDLLGLPSATCPKKGWDCACGFSHMSLDRGGARCQNFMYTVSYEFTETIYKIIIESSKYLFTPVLLLVIALFGQKRTQCSHGPRDIMSNWFGYKRNGNDYYCRGSCVFELPYREWSVTCIYETIRDEFAWVIFYVSTILWSYSFLGLLWLSFFTMCSFIVWIVIAIICLVIVCFMMVNGDSSSSSNDCCCTPCGGTMSNTTVNSTGSITNNYYYYNYPYYYGDCGSCNCDCCSCCSSNECCRWLSCYYLFKKLFLFFPQIPSNRKGGFIGYLIGTHPLRTTYLGGSKWKDIITGSTRVESTISSDDLDIFRQEIMGSSSSGVAITSVSITRETTPSLKTNLIQDELVKTGTVKGVSIFERGSGILESNDLIGTSMDDYTESSCQLCFDKTTTYYTAFECGHGCCHDCAMKIIDKQVPCPYCRKHFTTLVKGKYTMDIV